MLRAAVLADSKPPMMYPCPLSSTEAKLLRGAGIEATGVYWSRMTSYLVILRNGNCKRLEKALPCTVRCSLRQHGGQVRAVQTPPKASARRLQDL